MKKLDKKTEKKFIWFFIPIGIIGIFVILELFFGYDFNIGAWVNPALLGCLSVMFIAYAIAAWRQKCWGLLVTVLCLFIITALNMGNVFVKLLYPDAP